MVKAVRSASRSEEAAQPTTTRDSTSRAGQPTRQSAPSTPPRSGQAAQPRANPGSTFRDALSAGGEGPEMVVISAGRFRMGCLSNDADCFDNEKPRSRRVDHRAFRTVRVRGDVRSTAGADGITVPSGVATSVQGES